MANLIEAIDQDLKRAMLAGDKSLVNALKVVKSAVQYSLNSFNDLSGVSDEEIIKVLRREVKKREEASKLYIQGGNIENSEQELYEKKIIEKYLPELMTEDKIQNLIDEVIAAEGTDAVIQANLGKIIGMVQKKAGGGADGAVVAKLVKARIE